MAQTFPQRMISYEESTEYKLLRKIPIIIKIDGRSFSTVTRNIQKPFCHKTMSIMNGTMLSLVKQIDGAIFGYTYSDKIIIVLRNDRSETEDPWFGNNIQDICSTTSSLVTYEFLNHMWEIEKSPQFEGSITFKTKVFGIPNISEVINYLIYSQYCCIQHSINSILTSIIGNNSVLDGVSFEDRKKALDDAGISLNDFPSAFRFGVASYIVPQLHRIDGTDARHRWLLDLEIPLFTEQREKLRTIIKTGSDIFRPERDFV
jgi:tRNA(His) guanylyltransferase